MVSSVNPPVEIPGYRILDEVGRGGMASVYLAVQETLEREVALKLMSPALSADPLFHQQFLSEGRIVAKLSHPCIVTIYDIGQVGTRYYMAMEYAPAGNLKERLRNGVSVRDAVRIVREIGAALGYAHERGFVHRDVKPANILFKGDGTAVLSDFGIAKSLDTTSDMTRMGLSAGTPSYMSPEQSLGVSADPRSDLYSLGVVFLEMLTGSRLVQRNADGTLAALTGPAAYYANVLEQVLAPSPERRVTTAERLIRMLDGDPGDATVIRSAPPDWTGTSTATDTARTDLGRTDTGRTGTGRTDTGQSDAGPSEWGQPAWGQPDWGRASANGGSAPTGAGWTATGPPAGHGAVAPAAPLPVSAEAPGFAGTMTAGPHAWHDGAGGISAEPPGASAAADTTRLKPTQIRGGPSLGAVLIAIGLVLLAVVGWGFWTHYRGAQTPPERGIVSEPPVPVEPETRSLTEAERAKVARLLEVAEVHQLVGRLFSPPGGNAYEAYQMVLEVDPANSAALAGLAELQTKKEGNSK